ncbi:hypothetical protein [Actinomadura sp. WMMB 499]|uniref:hypothetical protein n=1 Tax=Actinomadura sp. WMMB 499 TaxID=1219491 RepID=UPI001244C72A|nr:hypothetical protein [Actinomadura sp. WMMB 499]QFG21236.1 hypothetical protein F7P10_08895 [Actinomadura sp. WMMB 499]
MSVVVDGLLVDTVAIRREIERRFPGVVPWYGEHTRRWWAVVWCGRWVLLEAPTPRALVGAIEVAASRRSSVVR